MKPNGDLGEMGRQDYRECSFPGRREDLSGEIAADGHVLFLNSAAPIRGMGRAVSFPFGPGSGVALDWQLFGPSARRQDSQLVSCGHCSRPPAIHAWPSLQAWHLVQSFSLHCSGCLDGERAAPEGSGLISPPGLTAWGHWRSPRGRRRRQQLQVPTGK